ncbi:MAG: trans-aconitate 2-methyltransferase [Hyphomonadaceae bacterium]
MNPTHADRGAHWDMVYANKPATDVSWHQPQPELSLKLIRRTMLARDSAIIDVGGGASALAEHLLRDGFSDVSVLDIAASSLGQAQQRLGGDAAGAEWIVVDVLSWRPTRTFDLWHDRAMLHFLTDRDDQAAYANILQSAVRSGGWAIIGGFAPHGPAQCSGLDVVRHDASSLRALLGSDFALMETHGEIHLTPQGREQAFRFHLFARK